MYFPRNWELDSTLSKLRNFGGRVLNPQTPPRYATACVLDLSTICDWVKNAVEKYSNIYIKLLINRKSGEMRNAYKIFVMEL
jgi:hypothetical protein